MQHITNIHSNGQPDSIQLINDKIYIPTNIHVHNETVEGHLIEEYEYDCDIYTKDEYIILIAQQTNRIAQLEEELAAAKILLGVDE